MTETIIDYEPIVDILFGIFGDYKTHNSSSGQVSFSCPVCSYDVKALDKLDGKGNLEVNYKQGVYKCWVCAETHGTYGNIYYLVKKYGSKRELKKFVLLMPEDQGKEIKKLYNPVKLPKEFKSFKNCSAGLKMTPIFKTPYNYIKKRNITDEMIEKFNIGFCYEGEYKNRIIIPSYDEESDLTYFVARSYENNPFLKYKNPEAEKEIIIFNEYLIDWDKPISLVEGAFDHLFVENSIPMLGKKLGDLLFSMLYEKAKKITLILDGDAWTNSQKIFHQLNGGRLFGKVWVTKLPSDKDIADLQGDLTEYPPFQID